MKTKNLKKALSLFLAVLMIALTIPFTLLTFAAEEATEITINDFSVFGKFSSAKEGKADENLYFQWYNGKNSKLQAFDEDIKTEAQTKGFSDIAYKMCYFDTDGVMQHGKNTDEQGKSYYGIFIVELSSPAEVEKLSLWTYYNDNWGEGWMSNDAYDIWYSADGSSYTKSAEITDASNKSSHETGTYNGTEGYVRNIAMDDVTAKYIAIAVSEYAPASDNDQKEMIFYEIVVTGTALERYELGINSLTPFGNWVDGYEPISFRGDKGWTEDKAYDGDITSDAQTWFRDNRDDFVMTHFDANGGMKQGPAEIGTSYFGIFVVELDDYAKIDTLSLWTPYVNDSDPANRPYMANNGYDIYYSVDGASYTAVDGASFKDVYAKQSTADALYVEGTYNGNIGHVHNIDMGGVTAGYIAIAVSDLAYSTTEIIFSEIVVEGEYTSAPKGNIEAFYRYSYNLDGKQTVDWDTNYPGSKAIDGSIAAEDEAQTYTKGSLTTSPFTVLMPGTNIKDAVEKKYYALFEIVLNEETEVSSLSIWTPYYGDENYPEFMSNDGYDIYYSADGENYYAAKDATFENVYSDKDNNGYYVESMHGTDKGHVHDIDMGDVKAKWVVIAVSAPVCSNEDTYMIFSELVVHGTPTALEIDNVSAFGRHKAVDEYGNVIPGNTPVVEFYGSYPAKDAFDGDITSDAQILNTNRDGMTLMDYEMCYFDADGAMVYGENPDGKSYYLMFVIELEEYSQVDTLSLWTPYANADGPTDVYMANNGYDIYYSVDGTSYTAVDGATFEDVYDKQSTADALYVAGTYNGNNGYVHNIDMGSVEAKYIAIAVSDIVRYEGEFKNDEAIISEVTVNGGAVKKSIDKGASVRIDDPTGIRFTGTVARTYYDRLVKEHENVKIGMLIAPTVYLDYVDEFTKEALDAWNGAKTKYLEIDADAIVAEGNTDYRIKCAMVNIKENNMQREFSARLYIKVINGDKTEYIYSGFSKTGNSRSVAYVATAALSDVSAKADSTYENAVTTVYGENKYSPYDDDERSVLEGFSEKASSITVMSYNIKGTINEGQSTDKAYEFIANSGVDVIGIQEDDSGDTYEIVDINSDYEALNDGGNGDEVNAILYDSTKFTKVTSGTVYFKKLVDSAEIYATAKNITRKYVDDDGNTKVAEVDFDLDDNGDKEGGSFGGLVGGTPKGRFFRWAVLKDKATGVEYLVINTHLHNNPDGCTDAQKMPHRVLRQAQAMLIKLWLENDATAKKYSNTIVLGDLNDNYDSTSLTGLVNASGDMAMAINDAAIKGDVGGTYVHGYANRDVDGTIYDYVIYNSEGLSAVEYSAIDNKLSDGKYPSDHLPVRAKFIAK